MPIYEYRCDTCQNEFEFLTVTQDKEEVLCPQCKSDKVQKLLSASVAKSSSSTPVPGLSSAGCGGSSGFS